MYKFSHPYTNGRVYEVKLMQPKYKQSKYNSSPTVSSLSHSLNIKPCFALLFISISMYLLHILSCLIGQPNSRIWYQCKDLNKIDVIPLRYLKNSQWFKRYVPRNHICLPGVPMSVLLAAPIYMDSFYSLNEKSIINSLFKLFSYR